MNLLFIGDIVGRPGRNVIAHYMSALREEFALDIVIANAENAAGGLGVTPQILDDLFKIGINGITLGNHTWRKKELAPALDRYDAVVRPANYPDGVPGRGAMVLELAGGRKLGVVNLLGRVYMDAFDCPYARGRQETARLREQTNVVIVDFHGEATSEKVAFGWHMDGYCTAVLGTHTHVQTADERVLPNGTAYITDVGMTGPRDSVIGLEKERAIRKFLDGMPNEFKVAKGPASLAGVVVAADEATGKAVSIQRISRTMDESRE